ncbi:uncharacterized protein LOC129742349 [Uranotaenia lowii]|uniref:uncharacterized protein LOC129742349 n=1 Tax=Uranotaenia lowii TaxID=190385 RepID=UPI00247A0F85|nr:uncharacterized protein LOC129742349 [Uranotaenia lowii]
MKKLFQNEKPELYTLHSRLYKTLFDSFMKQNEYVSEGKISQEKFKINILNVYIPLTQQIQSRINFNVQVIIK